MIEFQYQKRGVVSSNTVKKEVESHQRAAVAAEEVATKKFIQSFSLQKPGPSPLPQLRKKKKKDSSHIL